MTATITVCMPWCDSKGHHPDNHCVQPDTLIPDLYGRITTVAAYADSLTESVGVYVGSQLLHPGEARRMAAALLNAADAAEQALRIFDGEEAAR